MSIQFVSTSGRLTIKDTSGGSVLFDGTCGTNTSYRASSSQTTAQCQDSAEEEVFTSVVTHELSGTYNYQTDDTTSVLGLTNTSKYAVYLSQNGTTLFAGTVLLTSAEDSQGSRGTPETVSISARNSGTPTTGALAAS